MRARGWQRAFATASAPQFRILRRARILAVELVMLGTVVLLLYKLKQLRQLMTVCAWTKEVKHDGRWVALEEFLKARFNFDTSHSISERGRKVLRGEASASEPVMQ
jgi:hypothetical protein